MELLSIINEKIKYNKSLVDSLKNETMDLEKQKKQAEKNGIEKWIDNTFESSSGLTEEFSSFAKDFKKYLKDITGFELLEFNRGHFYLSGFLKNKKTEKFVYFSTSDVRYFKNEWWNNVLVREAKGVKDYTGGSNYSCELSNLKKYIEKLSA